MMDSTGALNGSNVNFEALNASKFTLALQGSTVTKHSFGAIAVRRKSIACLVSASVALTTSATRRAVMECNTIISSGFSGTFARRQKLLASAKLLIDGLTTMNKRHAVASVSQVDFTAMLKVSWLRLHLSPATRRVRITASQQAVIDNETRTVIVRSAGAHDQEVIVDAPIERNL